MGIVVAIDGPAGSGKGTLGKALAAELGLAYLDTGLLYRAVACKAMAQGVGLDDKQGCWRVADGLQPGDMTDPALRSEEAGQAASKIAVIGPVRVALLDLQRRFSEDPPGNAAGAVLDGRDIGTVVCPDADLKIFLTADPEARVLRRAEAALKRGEEISTHAMARSLRERDQREATRDIAPMRPAADAIVIDTSHLTAAEVLEQVMGLLLPRLACRGMAR